MAIQLQLRKGTKAQNDAFTGAEGELTYDTDSKGLRVHDGQTPGGHMIDAVVAWQVPTAENNYTWYRKYASGWVEQGGYNFMNGYVRNEYFVITLPITMADTNYTVSLNFESKTQNYHTGTDFFLFSDNYTTTSFHYLARGGDSNNYKVSSSWQVSGMAA